MPRYYFHVSLEGTLLPDPDGQDLPDADAAWEAARGAARDLMETETELPVDWLKCHFEVRDADGAVVLELPFAEALPLADKGRPN